MKLFLVEAYDQVDADTLDCLSSWLPQVPIEIFGDTSAVLNIPPSSERLLICVSSDLVTPERLDSIRRMQVLFPRATLVLIRRTADLLPLCTILSDSIAHGDLSMAWRGAVPAAGRTCEPQTPKARLSEREAEIMLLLREGLQNKLIARRLDLSVSTVKTHIANIFRKIDASNRLDAICKFADQGQTGAIVAVPEILGFGADARMRPLQRPGRPAMPFPARTDWAA